MTAAFAFGAPAYGSPPGVPVPVLHLPCICGRRVSGGTLRDGVPRPAPAGGSPAFHLHFRIGKVGRQRWAWGSLTCIDLHLPAGAENYFFWGPS